MTQDNVLPEQPVYFRLTDLATERVETGLPIERDEGGRVEGYPGTRVEYELQRLNRDWRRNRERKLGVGKRVLIKSGTPVRFSNTYIFGDYVTTGDITGTLKKESDKYLGERQINPALGTDYSNITLEWREITHSLFTVTVDLPSQKPGYLPELANQVDILVPNDMLLLAEESSKTSNKQV